jgi:mRNA interferase HigB
MQDWSPGSLLSQMVIILFIEIISHCGKLFTFELLMRIYSKGTLKKFWEKHVDARTALEFWYSVIETNRFEHAHDIVTYFRNADQVGNGRIVFNIANNKYRLVAKFEYSIQCVFVRFIGTHKEYDRIENIKNI